MNPEEIKRLIDILLLMTERETTDFLWDKRRRDRRFIFTFADAIEVDRVGLHEYQTLNRLAAHFKKLRAGEIEHEEPTFECVGCGPLAEAKGLRWKKLGEGKPVTISVDHTAKPQALNWLTDEIILKEWFQPWTKANPKAKFKLLKTGKGDCHIKWERIDGPGNTLKYVWQPAGDAEFMEEAGDLSGDMVCDSSERTYPKALVHEAGKHEVGHVLGIGHLKSVKDVMYPTARGVKKPLSNNDKKELNERHPIEQTA